MSLYFAGPAEEEILQRALLERFGIPSGSLRGWRVLASGSVIWGVRDHRRLEEAVGALVIERTGLPLMRRVGHRWKPTTVALQALGVHLTLSRAELDGEELDRLVRDGRLRGTRPGLTDGYVAVAGPLGVAGCALYFGPRPQEGKEDGVLLSQFARARWDGLKQQLSEPV